MSNNRSGYLLEHRYSNIQIIDETNSMTEFPEHIQTIGQVLVWREDIIPVENGKDRKVTYYKLRKTTQEDIFVSLITDYDQNLSNLSIETVKKQADPHSQQRINRIFLYLSFTINIFLFLQQSMNPYEPFFIDITPSNAGWLLFLFAAIKIIDLMQERPAIFSGLYVQYWAKVYNPSEQKLVDVAFVTMFLTDKQRVSDHLPVAIQEEQILALSYSKKKAEDKYEAEYASKISLERNLEDSKKAIKESNIRAEIRAKQAYADGLKDAQQNILKKSAPREFFKNYPTIGWPIAAIVFSIVFYFLLKNMAISIPAAVFIVEISQLPLVFWILLFVLGFFTIRWFFKLFETR